MTSPEVRSILFAKRGNLDRECEDALAVNGARTRFVVVDGATEGIDSRRWARSLARSFAIHGAGDDPVACSRALGDRQQARWNGREVPWYLAEKAQAGAFAAFVGVEIRGDRWDALAVGDCCLVATEPDGATSSFPLEHPEQFTSRPVLVASNHARYEDIAPRVVRRSGAVAPGTRLLLLSDAIAAWYLGPAGAAGRAELHAALDRDDAAAVHALADRERTARTMRNDDVAVLRVTWGAAAG